MDGMTEKRTVSLPPDVAKAVDALVAAGKAPSFSAVAADALRDHVAREQSLTALRAWTGGPPSAEDQRWAEEQLGIKPARGAA